jgi:AraC family transcriptional regulator
MNFRIEKKDAFRIVGVSEPLQKEIEKNFEAVPRMWEKAAVDGTVQKFAGMMDSTPKGILGVCACGDSEDWRYFIAVASTRDTGCTLEQYTVPALTWAIFSGAGECPVAIQELEKRITAEWLPASDYEYNNSFEIEVYLTPDPQNAEFEVWIPVTKKV